MADIVNQVDAIFAKHVQAFKLVERVLSEEHSIPESVTRDAIKQRILGALSNELSSNWIFAPAGFARSLMLFSAAMSYLVWCLVAGPWHRKVQADVLFDHWVESADQFYGGILEELTDIDVAAFGASDERGRKSPNLYGRYFTRSHRPYSKRAAWKILKAHCWRFGQYWMLARSSGVGIVDLVLRLCAEIAGHLTSIEGISAKVLVSGNDNGYGPSRYHIYRSNGIASIVLIQNGGRVFLTNLAASYICCDYYLGWSQGRIDNFIEMRCSNKVALGSIRLSNFLTYQEGVATNIQYDVLFVEHIYEPLHPRSEVCHKFLRNLVRYASENPSVKVAYQMRPRRNAAWADSVEKIDSILNDSQVAVLDNINAMSAYEHVSASLIVVTLNSSMRCEALGLGKTVLSCSDRSEPQDFVVKNSDACFVVSSDQYEVFRAKIDFLLANLKAPLVSARLAEVREAAGVLVGSNVSKSAAEIIRSELNRICDIAVPGRRH